MLRCDTSKRKSNLELYRIILMLLIISHHYVINSGVIEVIRLEPLSIKAMFLYFFGAWGKTGINCFIMITGYYMCKNSISIKKFLKILLEVKFYSIIIYCIFIVTGYEKLSLMGVFDAIIPIRRIETNFTNCFEMFYLIIPILNVLVQNMKKKQHEYLLAILGFVYVFLGTFRQVSINYFSWFIVLYFVASYIRLYPRKIFDQKMFWGGYLLSL